ncbi:MAG: hypothetical protein KJ065_10000 [Anaerolineae bacterium]|nr:hypothetical protein [Anaerolineae bacterium]
MTRSVPRQPNPDAPMPRDHAGMLLASIIMATLSWLGLYHLITTEYPRVGQRFIFFVLLMIAVAGTVIPFVRYLNVRFTRVTQPVPPSGVIVRQGVWVGLFVVLCAWMQIPRALTLPIAFFLALALIVVEIFLRSREIQHERENAR